MKRLGITKREHEVLKLIAAGMSNQEIAKTAENMAEMQTMLNNPLIRFPVFVMEILPVGFIVTLISAGLLRRREMLPT
jgi:Bacterial regulatory proteins, luxR family